MEISQSKSPNMDLNGNFVFINSNISEADVKGKKWSKSFKLLGNPAQITYSVNFSQVIVTFLSDYLFVFSGY